MNSVSGEKYWVKCFLESYYDDSGRLKVSITVQDITERKNDEQLREDIDRIAKHNLKSPLSPVVTLPDILLRGGDNFTENQKRIINLIKVSGMQVLKMINLSLDMYKIEKGIYRFDPYRFDIIPVLKGIKEEVEIKENAGEERIELYLEGRPVIAERFPVFAEEPLCYSALCNLFRNAVEASPPDGNVKVNVSKDEEANRAEITITNRGLIPQEIRSSIFNKYATFGKRSGTGLGAYSSKLIIEAMGGRVSFIVSEEDKTTTFTVELLLRPE